MNTGEEKLAEALKEMIDTYEIEASLKNPALIKAKLAWCDYMGGKFKEKADLVMRIAEEKLNFTNRFGTEHDSQDIYYYFDLDVDDGIKII